MAKSGRTGLLSASESREVMIAHPALGPSLGVAPAGTWMWMAFSEKKLGGAWGTCCSRKARENVWAMVALSFITSPS